MKKKILALLMCGVMSMMLLAGCGGGSSDNGGSAGGDAGGGQQTENQNPSEEAGGGDEQQSTITLDGSWPEEHVKIGVEVYDTSDEQLLAMQDYFSYLEENFNIEFVYSESLADPAGELDFIDSCASAGCKGIIGYYNVAGAQAMQEAIDQGMYYWGTEQYYDDFADNDHYVGCYTLAGGDVEGNGDFLGGYEMGYNLGKQGVKHVFYCSGGTGFGIQMFLDRMAGFEAGVAAAQDEGAEIQYDPAADLIEGWPGTDDFTAAVGTKLNGDYDGVAVAFNAAAIFQPIFDAGKAESIKVATIGEVSDTYYDSVQSGMISTVVYDCEEVVFANGVVQLLNAITGNLDATRGSDGKAGKIGVSRWVITDADTYNAIYDYHDGGEFFVSAEEMANCLVGLNPEATFDSVNEFYGSYTLEGALASIQ